MDPVTRSRRREKDALPGTENALDLSHILKLQDSRHGKAHGRRPVHAGFAGQPPRSVLPGSTDLVRFPDPGSTRQDIAMSYPCNAFAKRSGRLLVVPLAAVVLSLAPTSRVTAQQDEPLICSEPLEPTCVDSKITFENEQSMDQCKDELISYDERIEEYAACLNKTLERLRKKGEETRKAFDCRANEGKDC